MSLNLLQAAFFAAGTYERSIPEAAQVDRMNEALDSAWPFILEGLANHLDLMGEASVTPANLRWMAALSRATADERLTGWEEA
jgi:hypothetical protein